MIVPDPLDPTSKGQTDLTEEEQQGLRLLYITTRAELNEAEGRNIARARRRRTPQLSVLLDDLYLRDLHRDMFGDVWTWAGTYRTTERNIGFAPSQIAAAVRNLVDDARLWFGRPLEVPDVLAAQFHHRLVEIHPFPNGNGRHARLATELLQRAIGETPFTWGATLDESTAGLRERYVQALREADRTRDVSDLIRFARS